MIKESASHLGIFLHNYVRDLSGPEKSLLLFPIFYALFVWLSVFSFVPVPWPDDSAFYFVAHELFKWPPRWVMLPQAPFEPTYNIINFNTMPLYPILIGLGRFVKIDGSFALKFWPILAWALSLSLIIFQLIRQKIFRPFLYLFAIASVTDPVLRWAAVLIRPESLIGLVAVILGWICLQDQKEDSKKFRWYYDPVSLCLCLGAYSHFNAIHLVPMVFFAYISKPKRLLSIGLKCILYLSPWIVLVMSYYDIFLIQMKTQWQRLAVGNPWLRSVQSALKALFQDMGAPYGWDSMSIYASFLIWMVIGGAIIALLFVFTKAIRTSKLSQIELDLPLRQLVLASVWVLSSCYLWHAKPEVWFTYYIHLSVWFWLAVFLIYFNQALSKKVWLRAMVGAWFIAVGGSFFWINLDQFDRLSEDPSWSWEVHRQFIECIDKKLVEIEKKKNFPKPFKVWDPTFPDITIELSMRHPDWSFTRTNDFYERAHLAHQHGKEVDVMVVPETVYESQLDIDGPASEHPEIHSIWMEWKQYFLNYFLLQPGWKPERWICAKHRWHSFIYWQ